MTRRSTTAAWLLITAVVSWGLVGCATQGRSPRPRSVAAQTPAAVIPGPAGLRSGTAPTSNGLLWALSTGDGAATLHKLDISSGDTLASIPVSAAAVAVSWSPSGVLGLGVATPTSGALETLDGATGQPLGTVPLPGPTVAVAATANGRAFLVLTSTTTAARITSVSIASRATGPSVPAALGGVALAIDPEGSGVWMLQANGVLTEIALPTGTIEAEFRVGHSGLALALSPDGGTLYVLKGRGQVRNVAVVDTATEVVKRVLPAPAAASDLALSPDGRLLYDFVGTAGYGNVQAFSVSG